MEKTKTMFFLIILVLVSRSTFAQAVIGVEAGVNTYAIAARLPSDHSFHWDGGFFSKAAISDRFALLPELLYTGKGSVVHLNGHDDNLKLNYIEFAFTGVYNPSQKLFVEAGPVIGYLLSVKRSTAADDSLLKQSSFSPFSFGLLAGGGVDLDRFVISIRYDLGLTNLILESDPANQNNPLLNAHNRGFQLSFGFIL